MAIVIFRTYRDEQDETRDRLYRELLEGRLRQGWGSVGNNASMSLRDPQGDQTPQSVWEADYSRIEPDWGEPTAKRYTILVRMLEVVQGDVIIAPNMHADGQFSVASAIGRYDFALPDWYNDFGHILTVSPTSVRTFTNDENEHTCAIVDIIRPYRDAVNIVRQASKEAELHRALAGLGFEGHA